jgi:hypothetical protein
MVTQKAESFFAWIDYSEAERRKALDVIDLFKEQDTRDELGIGTIRDAFADLLFPGTSTIQTRAKYFLFIPWTYIELERLRVPSDQIANGARNEETSLIRALLESGDTDGVIGKEVGGRLKRLPSSIYWQGLRTWGIRRFAGSQAQYHRSLDRFYRWDPRSSSMRTDDGEPLDGVLPLNWDPGIPPRPSDFPRRASLRLSVAEAEYLKERILSHANGTLLAFIVDTDSAFPPVRFPWAHPRMPEMPERLVEQLLHARNFSEAMHGAALLYNLMLADLRKDEARLEEYQERLQGWSQKMAERTTEFSRWERARFWEIVHSGGARITVRTRAFVDRWLDLALATASGWDIARNDAAARLISERERAIKGERARLHNRRALELWSGAAGTAQLTYRWWPFAQRITLDIIEGLTGEQTDAQA